MKAMIFAAGLGTRLKPLTDSIPKALVPVAGKTLLEIQIEKLAKAGFTDIVVNVHHFAGQIVSFVEHHGPFGARIQFSHEEDKLLDTGGAVKKALPLLTDDGASAEPFLIHNVDILSNADLAALYNKGMASAATLLVSERETSRYLLFDQTNRLVGWTNVKTGETRSPYPDLDVTSCKRYAFSGIHTFSPRLAAYFDRWPDKFSITDFYLSVCHLEPIYGLPVPGLKVLDVGKTETLKVAEDFYRDEYCPSR